MGLVSVIAAAAASWVFGAVWYMILSKPWITASGVECDSSGKPANTSPLPFILSAICMLLVAGMMRHIFAMSGIETVSKGALTGLGIGLFFIAPWTMINNAYAGRPFALTMIDGGYAVFGCTIIGAVLTLL
ncbi:DUF1761 domain-containing protein [Marivita geojedonensis]|uniref:DUF1761 domain-containing protein n=1 Tax=Marivita geojedonensis TaxID=1123756 RepID=A0A1X4NJJ5_9RHOB|nr:DUF1761 domain-containing protein [Marivita geojedonensis]OSQ49849.1 hypothetical protein MGEO_12470 [Marivita geojedonensis]PRY76072.1 uncharacterized protein DUF1761 [Marivita geojedonensis]